jgi:hypothetical protein
VDVNASNERLFGRCKLGQSRRHRAKVELIIRREEIRLAGASFRVFSVATPTDTVGIDLHLKPTLLASPAVFHLIIVQHGPELAECGLVAVTQCGSVKVAIPHRILCMKNS